MGNTRHDDLPAIIDGACRKLGEARNSAEVMEARAEFELALHYARITKAANETHADCLRMIVRCETLMADKIDEGQANGDVAGVGNPAGANSPRLGELNIPSQRLSEWRKTRDAGVGVVEQALEEALSEGRAPTKADIHRHVRGTFGTGEIEWYTPAEYVEKARAALGGIDLDPASSEAAQRTVKAKRFYTIKDDGLAQPWKGRIWLNPPYAQPQIGQFIAKLIAERKAGRVASAIVLTHNYTDTGWFHDAESIAALICFTRGRVKFYDAKGVVAAPTQGQAFFYIGGDRARFRAAFSGVGFIR